jgi:hypothetical protein
MLRIDVKIVQAAICRSDVSRLIGDQAQVIVWDMTPIWNRTGEPLEVGKAWISGSGRAVMYIIAGRRYISPLSQVKAVIAGIRKTANISTIEWTAFLSGSGQTALQAVLAWYRLLRLC